MLTRNSSAQAIQFEPTNRPEHKSGFAQVREAWLQRWQEHDQLRHADRALVTQIFRHFNQCHYQETTELLAWPSWETIAARARLSRSSIFRGLQKLERLGALKIIHGGRDPKTGWKLPNAYHAIVLNTGSPGGTVKPGQVSNRHKTRCQGETRLSDIDSSILKKEGLPRKQEGSKQGKRPEVYIAVDDSRRAVAERYVHVLGFMPPKGRGWSFSLDQWHLIELAAAANGGGQ
jgi:hypothetical protein